MAAAKPEVTHNSDSRPDRNTNSENDWYVDSTPGMTFISQIFNGALLFWLCGLLYLVWE